MSRRIASFVPFYEYDEARFFRSDDPPEAIAAQRQAGFTRLAAHLSGALCRRPPGRPLQVADGISDLQFTDAYRVPFQYSRFVRQHLPLRLAPAVVGRRDGRSISMATSSMTSSGSYGVNLFGYDFYKGCMERGEARVRDLGPVLGAYHPVIAECVGAAEGDFRPRRSVVPHVGHRGRHAGGAARALSYAPVSPGSILRRLSRLVGRRAAGHRQSACRRAKPTRSRTCRRTPCACCAAAATLPACWSIRCRRCIPTRARRPIRRWSTAAGTPHFDRQAYTDWLKRLRAVCTERNIVLIFDEVFVGFRLARRRRAGIFRRAGRPRDLRQDARRRACRSASSAAAGT